MKNITAHRLRLLREKRQMSQREVAEQLGITRAAYNKYERGISCPVRRLNELSALFDVSVDYIMGRDRTRLEQELIEVDSITHEQVCKYLRLSDNGRRTVDIMLDAVCAREEQSYRDQ